jgi:ADP-heptose:LPS heptosyltransferase
LKVNPKINQVFVYERDEFVESYRQNPLKFLQKWFSFFKVIRREKFEVVFDFSLNNTFGFLSGASGIKRRIGFNYRGRGQFLTDKIELKGFEGKHVVGCCMRCDGIRILNLMFPIKIYYVLEIC